jgi:7,8-dihydropterin-6-yl-methyl-4-(beta-D-ribofuranosyl)aminobenzene 5'-phosphate synthase
VSNDLKLAIRNELKFAEQKYLANELTESIHFLERAHVLGQRYFWIHLITHLYMLRIAVKRREGKETVGQVIRIFATVPGYIFGWVPVGNTGGANVSAIKPMLIPSDLQTYFTGYSVKHEILKRGLILIFLVAGTIGAIFINHSIESAAVEKAWANEPIVSVAEFGTTKTLEITPIVNWHAQKGGFKTEAGVSYLVKTDKKTILYDVGWNQLGEDESPLLHNLKRLGVKVADIDMIFLSHAHRDHFGGQKWVDSNTFSLANTQIDLKGKSIYSPISLSYPNATITVLSKPSSISNGLASTGPISRKLFMGKKYFSGTIEEQALVVNVEGKGLVVIVGCGGVSVILWAGIS